MRALPLAVLLACSSSVAVPAAGTHLVSTAGNRAAVAGTSKAAPCTTRIEYGPSRKGANSFARFSNGWKAYFSGRDACGVSFDASPGCGPARACATRVSDGEGRLPPPNQCGELYTNPVIGGDCPDPGVLHDGSDYVLTCTSGNAPNAFPMYTSTDLTHWASAGYVFPAESRPTWAESDFWASEIHKVGSHYVAYFTARARDGKLSVGAATAASATGPFTDIGAPLIHDGKVGLIDPSEITASNNVSYVIWKEDGNATGAPTPIHAQRLAPDGLSLVGSPSTLITNDQKWEGEVTEAPFMVERNGTFYLFYSGNSYANGSYAVGVARGPSPMGPMTKASGPILATGGAWAGPGHCSVVDTPSGGTALVYHAWPRDCVGGEKCGRATLVDEIVWGEDGWPSLALSPSSTSRPKP